MQPLGLDRARAVVAALRAPNPSSASSAARSTALQHASSCGTPARRAFALARRAAIAGWLAFEARAFRFAGVIVSSERSPPGFSAFRPLFPKELKRRHGQLVRHSHHLNPVRLCQRFEKCSEAHPGRCRGYD